MKAFSLDTTTKSLVVALAFVIPLSVSITTGLSFLLAICCLLNLDKQKLKQGFTHPISIAILVLLGLYLLSATHSVGNAKSIHSSLRKMSRLLYFPLLIPLFSMLLWRQRVLLAYLAAIFLSVITVLILALDTRWVFNPTPVFKDSIFTSLFVAYAIFVLSHFVSEYPRYKWLNIALIAVFSYYLLFLNYGRIGQLLFFVLYAIFLWQKFGFKPKYYLAAGLALALILAVISAFPNALLLRASMAKQELLDYVQNQETNKPMDHTSSLGLRLMMARNSIELIKQKPWFGWGAGGFKQGYSQFVSLEKIDKQEDRSNPHNQYLLTWVETGVFGFLALLYLFYSLLRRFAGANTLEGRLGVGLVVSIAIGCLANSWLLDFTSMFFFVLLAAVLTGANLNADRRS